MVSIILKENPNPQPVRMSEETYTAPVTIKTCNMYTDTIVLFGPILDKTFKSFKLICQPIEKNDQFLNFLLINIFNIKFVRKI